jgi:ABC-type dipeptide/oligopeptide/nickel transport system permease subunit
MFNFSLDKENKFYPMGTDQIGRDLRAKRSLTQYSRKIKH